MSYHSKALIIFSSCCLTVYLSSCSTISFYGQSISGQLAIINAQQPIETVLSTDDVSADLQEKLQQTLKIREFASKTLLLPDNDSYRSYADTGRDYVVWNVIATPAFSLQPVKWCFLVVGCLSYRGYFSRHAAEQYAARLKRQGYDVYVAGVSAYSTLGWFDDPVLNTMLRRDMIYLAKIIFHELAHQKLYIKNDTAFNEAFADTVAEVGVRRWLESNNRLDELQQFEQSLKRQNEFIGLITTYKSELEALYNSGSSETDLRGKKLAIFKNMANDYEIIRNNWDGHDDYRAWFEGGLNNAKLAIVLTYRDLVSELLALLAEENNDLEHFYFRAMQLDQCEKTERRAVLAQTLPVTVCLGK